MSTKNIDALISGLVGEIIQTMGEIVRQNDRQDSLQNRRDVDHIVVEVAKVHELTRMLFEMTRVDQPKQEREDLFEALQGESLGQIIKIAETLICSATGLPSEFLEDAPNGSKVG